MIRTILKYEIQWNAGSFGYFGSGFPQSSLQPRQSMGGWEFHPIGTEEKGVPMATPIAGMFVSWEKTIYTWII